MMAEERKVRGIRFWLALHYTHNAIASTSPSTHRTTHISICGRHKHPVELLPAPAAPIARAGSFTSAKERQKCWREDNGNRKCDSLSTEKKHCSGFDKTRLTVEELPPSRSSNRDHRRRATPGSIVRDNHEDTTMRMLSSRSGLQFREISFVFASFSSERTKIWSGPT